MRQSKHRVLPSILAAGVTAAGVVFAAAAALGEPSEGISSTTLELASKSFGNLGEIPRRFTCEGADVSPELRWSGVPEGTKSLVLIVDDPDAPDPAAPRITWVHWVLYDIPPSAKGLPEAALPAQLPQGAMQGKNSWKRTGYGGPCPPIGRHRYFHKLYALGEKLGDLGEPLKSDLLRAMKGKVLGKTELVGTYKKGQ